MRKRPKIQSATEVFNSCASEYQSKFMNFDLYNETLDIFCNAIIKKNPTVLELACGPGNITRYILEKRPDFNILATDLAPNMLDLAKRNIPQAVFKLMDCRECHTLHRKFDAVVGGFALPYLSKDDALQLIRDAAMILNPAGIIYLSTMEDDYAKSGIKTSSSGEYKTFTYYHEASYLNAELLENNFQIMSLQHLEFPEIMGTKSQDLVIIARYNPKN